MQLSHVVLFVITNDFCNSEFCKFEFTQACELQKRIILMVEENTNKELMPRDLLHVFKHKARIIWRYQDDELVLKTTWENICQSILDI